MARCATATRAPGRWIEWTRGARWAAPLAVAALLAVAGLACSCTALRFPAPPDWNEAEIAWQPYAEGLEQARREQKPILLLVYTQGCTHSPEYSRIFHAPEVVEQARGFVMVRIDADAAPELDARYMPDGGYLPRTFFLHSDGVPAYAFRGADPVYPHFLDYESPRELLALMRAARRALVPPPARRGSAPAS